MFLSGVKVQKVCVCVCVKKYAWKECAYLQSSVCVCVCMGECVLSVENLAQMSMFTVAPVGFLSDGNLCGV